MRRSSAPLLLRLIAKVLFERSFSMSSEGSWLARSLSRVFSLLHFLVFLLSPRSAEASLVLRPRRSGKLCAADCVLPCRLYAFVGLPRHCRPVELFSFAPLDLFFFIHFIFSVLIFGLPFLRVFLSSAQFKFMQD